MPGKDTPLTLDEIALKWGADKASSYHGYCSIYEKLFESFRDQPVQLLELGVYAGASLQTWNEYFTHPDAVIVGIDVCTSPGNLPRRRVFTYRCDQTEIPPALQDWHPDIVIDDASHQSSNTIASFWAWFPLLKPGAIYIVEDLHASEHFGRVVVEFLRGLGGEVGELTVVLNYEVNIFIDVPHDWPRLAIIKKI